MFGISWKYIVSGIILNILGSFMYDYINSEIAQFISFFDYITIAVIGLLYLVHFIHQKHHDEFVFSWDISEPEPEIIEREPLFPMSFLEEVARKREKEEEPQRMYDELYEKAFGKNHKKK